jgi:hypothetical protein
MANGIMRTHEVVLVNEGGKPALLRGAVAAARATSP